MTSGSDDTGSAGTYNCPNCGSVNYGAPDHCTRCGAKLRPRASSIGPGTIIDGKYEVLGLLGVGGMGEVFKVRHLHLDAIRCVKVMKKELMQDEAYSRRFVREAKVATRVHHPNVAIVHDFSTLDDGTYYMVHEFIDGITVRQWLSRNGRLPLGLALTMTLQVLSGLQHCHSRGLLHRDISGDNIMFTLDDEWRPAAKIIDLGIAKVTEASEATQRTMAGLFVGNPKYSSPEQLGQLRENEELDARTDLYSLGIVLYEMVVGVPPFYSRTPQGYMMQHLSAPVTPFRDVDPQIELPDGFEAIVYHALEKDRDNRYESAREFSRALRPFLKAFEGDEEQWVRLLLREFPSREAALQSHSNVSFDDSASKRRATISRSVPIDDEPWTAVDQTEDIDSLQSYLDSYPEGGHAEEASRRIALYDRIGVLEEQEKIDDLRTIAQTVHQVPVLANRVLTAIQRLERGERSPQRFQKTVAMASPETDEDARWRAADSTSDLETLNRYREEFPRGEHVDEAQRRIDLYARIENLESQNEISSLRVLETSVRDIPLLAGRVRQAIERLDRGQPEPAEGVSKTFATPGPPTQEAFKKTVAIPAADLHVEPVERRPSPPTETSGAIPLWPEGTTEEHALEIALADKSSRAFRRFLRYFPASKEKPRVQDLFEEALAWERTSTRAEIQQFLRLYPTGLHSGSAGLRLQELAEDDDFSRADAEGSIDAWTRFLHDHPSGKRTEEASRRLSKLKPQEQGLHDYAGLADEIRLYEENNDVPSLENLVAGLRYDHPLQLEAADALERLRARAQKTEPKPNDEDDWKEAERVGTLEAVQVFIHSHPASPRVSRARQLIDEIREWDAIKFAPSRSALERFVARWPDSRFRLEAERELEARKETPKPPREEAIAPTQHQEKVAMPMRTVAMGMEEPEAVPARPVLPTPPAPAKKGNLGLVLVALVVLALVVAGVMFLRRQPPSHPSRPSMVPGTLVVDASPWAQITSITDASGKEMLSSGAEYTPGLFLFPEGTYTVTIENPTLPGSKTLRTVAITPGGLTSVRESLSSIDATRYFVLEGWQ